MIAPGIDNDNDDPSLKVYMYAVYLDISNRLTVSITMRTKDSTSLSVRTGAMFTPANKVNAMVSPAYSTPVELFIIVLDELTTSDDKMGKTPPKTIKSSIFDSDVIDSVSSDKESDMIALAQILRTCSSPCSNRVHS